MLFSVVEAIVKDEKGSVTFTRNNLNGPYLTVENNYYVTHDTYNLIYRFNLSEFYESLEKIREYTEKIHSSCNKLKQKEICNYTTNLLKQNIISMETDLEYINSYHVDTSQAKPARVKRGFGNFLGHYIFNYFFGLMDDYERERIENFFSEITSKQNASNKIQTEFMTIINEKINLNHQELTDIKNNLENLYKQVNENTREIESEVETNVDITSLTNIILLIQNLHRTISIKLRSLLSESVNGVFSDLVPLETLMKQIKDIKQQFQFGKYTIPNLPSDIEKLISMKGVLYDDYILIHIRIPLIKREKFDLVRVFSVPVTLQPSTAILFDTPTEYYLRSTERDEYIPLSNEEKNNCRHLFTGKRICKTSTITYLKNNKNCVSNFFFNRNIRDLILTCDYSVLKQVNFILPLMNNSFYVYIRKPMMSRITCPGSKLVDNPYPLRVSGFVHLTAGCELWADTIKLYTNREYSDNGTKEIISPYRFSFINISDAQMLGKKREEVKTQKLHFIRNYQTDRRIIDELIGKSIKDMIYENEHFSQFKFNQTRDFIVYFAYFGLIVIVVLAIAILVLIIRCPNWLKAICLL